jgi:ketol-acid reductoisomerase
MVEIYEEVASGNEIRSVVLAGQRLKDYPLGEIDGSRMWKIGSEVRNQRTTRQSEVHPFTAGVFCGAMMAQVDVLLDRGHPYSEIANESVIEAVDSLLPYMHARGVAYMVDNCSTTARLGARKWGPRFDAQLTQIGYPAADESHEADALSIEKFRAHPVHRILQTLAGMRPSVNISVQ